MICPNHLNPPLQPFLPIHSFLQRDCSAAGLNTSLKFVFVKIRMDETINPYHF